MPKFNESYYVSIKDVDTNETLVYVSGSSDFPLGNASIEITETTLKVNQSTESGVDSNTKTLTDKKVIACGTTTNVSDAPPQTYSSSIAYVKLGGVL